MKKRIVLAGGSGFLGRELENYFINEGYEVIVLTRHPKKEHDVFWDAKTKSTWTNYIENAFAVINLAGKSVNCRYTEKNKAEILLSRVHSTKILGEAINDCQNPPNYWINSSTATIYDDRKGNLAANTENSLSTGNNFSVNIAKAWENEFNKHNTPTTKKIILRTSIVWGMKGGAFPVLIDLAKKGICSAQGSGEQWVSWIHINDFCDGIEFLFENQQEGIFNMASPTPLQNQNFYQLLKEKLNPAFVIYQPIWVLKLGAIFLQTETELILKSRKVVSQKLEELGFTFKFQEAEKAINDLVK